MALSVKTGREYVLGGKVYKAGEAVPENLIPAKYKALLTSAKGPLSAGPITSPTDLPIAAKAMAETAVPVVAEEAAPEAPATPQTYHRRDLVAAPVGQTGEAARSRSSRQARRQKGKN